MLKKVADCVIGMTLLCAATCLTFRTDAGTAVEDAEAATVRGSGPTPSCVTKLNCGSKPTDCYMLCATGNVNGPEDPPCTVDVPIKYNLPAYSLGKIPIPVPCTYENCDIYDIGTYNCTTPP
jgi:hypothetical protein